MQASVVVRRYPDETETHALVMKATPVRGTKKPPISMKKMNFSEAGMFLIFEPRLFDFLKIDYYRPVKIRISTQNFARSIPMLVNYKVKSRKQFGDYSSNFNGGVHASGPCIPWLEWMLGITVHDGDVIYVRASRIPYVKKGK